MIPRSAMIWIRVKQKKGERWNEQGQQKYLDEILGQITTSKIGSYDRMPYKVSFVNRSDVRNTISNFNDKTGGSRREMNRRVKEWSVKGEG